MLKRCLLVLLVSCVMLISVAFASDTPKIAIFIRQDNAVDDKGASDLLYEQIKALYENSSFEVIDRSIAEIKLRKAGIETLSRPDLIGDILGVDLIFVGNINCRNTGQEDLAYEQEMREYRDSSTSGQIAAKGTPIPSMKKKKYELNIKCIPINNEKILVMALIGGDSGEELKIMLRKRLEKELKNNHYIKGHVVGNENGNVEINIGAIDGIITGETVVIYKGTEDDFKMMFKMPGKENGQQAIVNIVNMSNSICLLKKGQIMPKLNDVVEYIKVVKTPEEKEEKNMFNMFLELF